MSVWVGVLKRKVCILYRLVNYWRWIELTHGPQLPELFVIFLSCEQFIIGIWVINIYPKSTICEISEAQKYPKSASKEIAYYLKPHRFPKKCFFIFEGGPNYNRLFFRETRKKCLREKNKKCN